jgi:hypothetical protein
VIYLVYLAGLISLISYALLYKLRVCTYYIIYDNGFHHDRIKPNLLFFNDAINEIRSGVIVDLIRETYFGFIKWLFIWNLISRWRIVMAFNATFNNISVISWRSVIFVEKTEEKRRSAASHLQSLSHNVVYRVHLAK